MEKHKNRLNNSDPIDLFTQVSLNKNFFKIFLIFLKKP